MSTPPIGRSILKVSVSHHPSYQRSAGLVSVLRRSTQVCDHRPARKDLVFLKTNSMQVYDYYDLRRDLVFVM